jgi:hypothetical protein
MADKIRWDVSNKNYIPTHGVSSVLIGADISIPSRNLFTRFYVESWKDAHLVPKEAYELLKDK